MEKMLTPQQAAELLGVSPITLRSWATRGILPASVTAGGHRRYAHSAVVEFARQRGISLNTSDDSLQIMIIEDDESFGRMLADYLRLRLPAADVHLANSGFEAGRMLVRLNPRVIILDLLMPGMSGVETCRMIKESDLEPAPKVIAMTGGYTPEVAREAITAGADACMGKPINIDELIAYIEGPTRESG